MKRLSSLLRQGWRILLPVLLLALLALRFGLPQFNLAPLLNAVLQKKLSLSVNIDSAYWRWQGNGGWLEAQHIAFQKGPARGRFAALRMRLPLFSKAHTHDLQIALEGGELWLTTTADKTGFSWPPPPLPMLFAPLQKLTVDIDQLHIAQQQIGRSRLDWQHYGEAWQLQAELFPDNQQQALQLLMLSHKSPDMASSWPIQAWLQGQWPKSPWKIPAITANGALQIDAYFNRNDNGDSNGHLHINSHALQLQPPHPLPAWQIDNLALKSRLEQGQDKWRIHIDSVVQQSEQEDVQITAWLDYYPQTQQWQGHLSRMSLTPWARLAALLPPLRKQAALLHALQGELREIAVKIDMQPQAVVNHLALQIEDLALSPDSLSLGFAGLRGQLQGGMQKGWKLLLDSPQLTLQAPHWWPSSTPILQALRGTLHVQQQEGWKIMLQNLHTKLEDAVLQADGTVFFPASDAAPKLLLNAQIKNLASTQIAALRPSPLLPKRLDNWLKQAFTKGRISEGQLRLHGSLDRFPFTSPEQGEFSLQLQSEGLTLRFHPDWPPLEELAATLLLAGEELTISATHGRLLGAVIAPTTARIQYLRQPLLEVVGKAEAKLPQLLRLVQKSPLQKTLRPWLQEVSGQGKVALDLELAVPLKRKRPPTQKLRFAGRLTLRESMLHRHDMALALNAITGDILFDQEGFSIPALQAKHRNRVLQLRSQAEQEPIAGQRFFLTGVFDSQILARWLQEPWQERLSGTATGQLQWFLPRRDSKLDFAASELQFNSSLEGLAIDLPPPLQKRRQEARPLHSQLRWQDGRLVHIVLHLGDLLQGQASRGKNWQGTWHIGAAKNAIAPNENKEELVFAGTLPQLALDGWPSGPLWPPSDRDKGLVIPLALQRIALDLEQLQIGSITTPFQLQLERSEDGWYITLCCQPLQGQLRLPPLLKSNQQIDFAARMLDLSPFQDKDKAVTPQPAPAALQPMQIDVRQLPAFELRIDELRWQQGKIENLFIYGQSTPAGKSLVIGNKGRELKLEGSGYWHSGRQSEGPHPVTQQSRLALKLSSSNLEESIANLFSSQVIKKGRGHIAVDMNWNDVPFRISLPHLQATFNWEFLDGELRHVSSGANRLINLLSFQTLMRRLVSDFSDVFSEGMVFKSIHGKGRLHKGILHIEKFKFVSTAAYIEAHGEVDLLQQTLQQNAVVVPNVSGVLPMLQLLNSGNPIAATGTFLFSKILGSLGILDIDLIAARQYHLHGNLDDVQVELVTNTP